MRVDFTASFIISSHTHTHQNIPITNLYKIILLIVYHFKLERFSFLLWKYSREKLRKKYLEMKSRRGEERKKKRKIHLAVCMNSLFLSTNFLFVAFVFIHPLLVLADDGTWVNLSLQFFVMDICITFRYYQWFSIYPIYCKHCKVKV